MVKKHLSFMLLGLFLALSAQAAVILDHDYMDPAQFEAWIGTNTQSPNIWDHNPGVRNNMEGFVRLQQNGGPAPTAALLFGRELPVGRLDLNWIGGKFAGSGTIALMAGDVVVAQCALVVNAAGIDVTMHGDGTQTLHEDFSAADAETRDKLFARNTVMTWENGVINYTWTEHANGTVHAFEGLAAMGAGNPDRVQLSVGWGTTNGKQAWIDNLRVWDTVDTSVAASSPVPHNGDTDIIKSTTLSWSPIEGTDQRDVYFGLDADAVANANRANPGAVLKSLGQTDLIYIPEADLDFGVTYYWRVDEINSVSNEVHKGALWSFEVEPYAYPLAVTTVVASSSDADNNPNATADGSGLDEAGLHDNNPDHMWRSAKDSGKAWIQYSFDQVYRLHDLRVWNYNGNDELDLGNGFKDVTIEVSENGTDWVVLKDAVFAQATGDDGYAANTLVDLDGVLGQHVKLTANTAHLSTTKFGLSEVQFTYVPVQARLVAPEDGLGDVDPLVVTQLQWRKGRESVDSLVCLSTDRNAVIDGSALVDTVSGNTLDLADQDLQVAQTYYWKVTEVNEFETPNAWDSPVWSFSTVAALVVDDFESYDGNFEAGTTIYQAWEDGWDDLANGSIVGNGDHAEKDIVRSGKQSLPMEYGNNGVSDSFAARTFEPSQNWTRMGVKYLSLYIHGDLRNISGQFYIKVNGKKVPFDGEASALTTPKWTRWVIELATLGIDTTKVTEMVIGVSGAGSSGKVYVDDITLVESALIAEEIYLEAEAADSISEPMMIVDDVTAISGQYIMMNADAVRDVNLPANENDGVAQYAFTVAGGTYQVACRVSCPAGGSFDSCFVRILGATTNTGTLEGGWINWNPMTEIKPDIWVWEDVLNFDQGSQKVLFTMDAGTYTLEIGRREQEAKVDAIVISEVVE